MFGQTRERERGLTPERSLSYKFSSQLRYAINEHVNVGFGFWELRSPRYNTLRAKNCASLFVEWFLLSTQSIVIIKQNVNINDSKHSLTKETSKKHSPVLCLSLIRCRRLEMSSSGGFLEENGSALTLEWSWLCRRLFYFSTNQPLVLMHPQLCLSFNFYRGKRS